MIIYKERGYMMTKKRNTALIILIFLTALLTIFIWSNSMLDGENSGALSKKITHIICGFFGGVPAETFDKVHHFVRKAAHFTEFAFLGILYTAIKNKVDKKLLSVLIFFPISCTLFTAVTDEFIQSFTGRGSSVRDVMLDFSGAVTGIIITTLVYAFMKGRKKDAKH